MSGAVRPGAGASRLLQDEGWGWTGKNWTLGQDRPQPLPSRVAGGDTPGPWAHPAAIRPELSQATLCSGNGQGSLYGRGGYSHRRRRRTMAGKAALSLCPTPRAQPCSRPLLGNAPRSRRNHVTALPELQVDKISKARSRPQGLSTPHWKMSPGAWSRGSLDGCSTTHPLGHGPMGAARGSRHLHVQATLNKQVGKLHQPGRH